MLIYQRVIYLLFKSPITGHFWNTMISQESGWEQFASDPARPWAHINYQLGLRLYRGFPQIIQVTRPSLISPSGALRRVLSWENNWVIFGVLTFLRLKSWYLTFLAGIYILRRMKLAGTNFLMPKVSRKACLPLCYWLNSLVPTLIQCSTNHPSIYAVNRL